MPTPNKPYLIVPKYLSNWNKENARKPEWVGSVVGRNYGLRPGDARNGPQLAGRRTLVLMPRPGIPFDPHEHVVDLGPNDPLKPQIFLPGFGEMDANEMKDLIFALEEKEVKRGWFDEQREKRGNINKRVRDYADQLVRTKLGKKTYGPGS